jgi:hypothetical protein
VQVASVGALTVGGAALAIGTFLPYGFMESLDGDRVGISGMRWGHTGSDVSLEFYGMVTGVAGAVIFALGCAQLVRLRRRPQDAPALGAWTAIVAVMLWLVAAWFLRQDWRRAREYSQVESIEFGHGLVISALGLAVILVAAAVMLVIDGGSLRFEPLKQAFGRWMDGLQS